MTQKELEQALPQVHNIQAIVQFRLSKDAPFTCVATFLAQGDAEIFAANIHPSFGIGQYQVVMVDKGASRDEIVCWHDTPTFR
jgi:hypothetical protein